MALNYINSPESDFSSGIDARSSENQIAAGFVKDLLNADTVGKRVRKRKGYQGYAGNVPVRVTSVEYESTDTQVCFTLDSPVSLETLRSSPLVVYGRSSTFTSGEGPFTTSGDIAKYYAGFTVSLRKHLAAPSGTLTIPGSEHGLTTTNMFVYVVESTSLSDRSFQKVDTDAIRIDESSFDVEIDYTVAADTNVFVFFSDKSTASGSAYVGTLSHGGSGSQTFSISAASHGLSNFNIIPQVQQDTGSERLSVVPEEFIVEADGDITITLNSASSATFYLLLSAAPIPNVTSGVVGASSTGSVTITDPTKPWVFFGIYLEQTPGGSKELVYPDSISYDETAGEFTMSFTNLAPTARNFIAFYEYGDARSNVLCVTDSSVTVDGTDDRPQLTIWGLDHGEIYPATKEDREGWVSHIDSYRRSGEQRLVCGLGGNLFSAMEYSEAGTGYLYPNLYPRLSARTSSDRILAPLLWDTGEAPGRSRGYITADGSGTHWATVTAVSFDPANDWTKYTISLPSKSVLDSLGTPTTLSSVISATPSLEDWLTVQGMSYGRHNGAFRIRQVQDGSDAVYIWVENDNNSADYDDSGTGGEAGVFTDQLTWTASGSFIPEDSLVSDVLECRVLSSLSTTTVADGLVDLVEVPAGVLFVAGRQSSVIPLRTGIPTSAASVTNLVRGDMLSYSGPDLLGNRPTTERLFRVRSVNPNSDITVGISASDGEATVTLGSGDTSSLVIGGKILLLNAGVYTGVQVLTSIPTPTTFIFETGETVTVVGATLAGCTAEIDEELQWSDTAGDVNVFRVEERWIPLEAPDDSFELTPTTHVRYFDMDAYASQSFLRSTMVLDNMYLTNGRDEVYKFDGSSIYRSGLPSWQPGLFLTQETSGATIVTNLRSLAYSAKTAGEGSLTITSVSTGTIPVGSSVRLSGSSKTYKVTSYSDDGTDYFVLLDRALDSDVSATGTVSEIFGVYRYYFRLNAVDANNNIIASATTGSQDHVAELTGNASVQLKLVGFPTFDAYDYSRLEVEIYRTKINQAAPFYRVTTLPLDFDNTKGYLQYRDSFADTDLTQLDIVNTALKGTELGTAWTDPLRAKYITSIGNKLVLGHVRDYPQLDIQIVGDATLSSSTFAGDTIFFRRDDTDSGTSTDMVNRVRYEWINGPTDTASNFVIGTDQFLFDTAVPLSAAAGDWVYLSYATTAVTGRDLTYSGWWQIADVTGSTVTVNLVGAAAATTYPDSYVVATDPTDVPVLLGTDGNLGMVNGDSFDTFDAMRRMSMAINATMRQVDITLSGYSTFVPWLNARGGNDLTSAGRLVVRQPRSDSSTFELVASYSGYDLFVNSIKRASGDQVSASTRLFPSRIIVSYENYPEIFDSPTTILDSDSDSAIDINSADGQEITGVIPFFGEAAFTAAQQSGVLVVFKTNSIYLVDLNEKAQGRNPVQRIETEGLGCTAPYSIAVTKNGIMFANESGIYCLRRNQAIQYIGRYMERNWTERVSIPDISMAQGHHYGIGRMYKLSVPLAEGVSTSTGYAENSEVLVYDHTNESDQSTGAWDRYDNHPATGWANLGSDAFFGSTGGRVFSVRRTGLLSDFRDDSDPVNFEIELRPNDFGNAGIRKVVDKVVVHYRTGATNTGTNVLYSVDLEEEFSETSPFTIRKGTSGSGVDDVVPQAVVSISHSVERRKAVYFGLKITNNNIDEDIEIAGVDFRVGGLQEKGILRAADTGEAV